MKNLSCLSLINPKSLNIFFWILWFFKFNTIGWDILYLFLSVHIFVSVVYFMLNWIQKYWSSMETTQICDRHATTHTNLTVECKYQLTTIIKQMVIKYRILVLTLVYLKWTKITRKRNILKTVFCRMIIFNRGKTRNNLLKYSYKPFHQKIITNCDVT